MTEIEQLKSDIATLEDAENVFNRKYGQTYQRYNIELDKMRKQLVRLEAQDYVLVASGIGELNQYLMDKCVGVVGDMTALTALDHIKTLEAKLESRPVVWCTRDYSGNLIKVKHANLSYTLIFPTKEIANQSFEGGAEIYTGESK